MSLHAGGRPACVVVVLMLPPCLPTHSRSTILNSVGVRMAMEKDTQPLLTEGSRCRSEKVVDREVCA